MGFLSRVGGFFAHHWKAIAQVAAVVTVGVVLTVATGGLLGVPALVALGGGIVGGGGFAAAGAAAVGAFGAGVTSYLLGNAFGHRRSTWTGALVEGTKSVAITFATLGLAKGLGFLAPFAGRALQPVTKPVGEAIAPFVRPVADAVAHAAKPIANATTRSLEAVNDVGSSIRQGLVKAVAREPVPTGAAPDIVTAARQDAVLPTNARGALPDGSPPPLSPDEAAARARAAATSKSRDLRAAATNRKDIEALPRSVTGATDSSGATVTGVTAGDLNATMKRVLEEQGFDLAAMERDLDVAALRRALENPAVRAALDPRLADAMLALPDDLLVPFDAARRAHFLALPWNCSEAQALHASLAAGASPSEVSIYTALTRTNPSRIDATGTAFKACDRCAAILDRLHVHNASDAEIAGAVTRTDDTTAAGAATQTSHGESGAASTNAAPTSEGFTHALEKVGQ